MSAPLAGDPAILLAIARRAIEEHLGVAATAPAPADEAGPLLEKRGAFVTLRDAAGELRGCVGFVEPRYALAAAVRRAAVSAASSDGRFDPVAAHELRHLRVEVSVLGPLEPIAPEAVEIGRHGLMIRHDGRTGLLLPRVPIDHGWDREAFLDHTCRKAGLPSGTWRQPGVVLLGFTAASVSED